MICVIPARGGSQRIPRKNIKDFHGRPIIAYSIALGFETCDRVIVSTDSDEIGNVAQEYGAEWLDRPSALGRDEIGTQEVIGHACRELGLDGTVCGLYATSPLLRNYDIDAARIRHKEEGRGTCRYSADSSGQPTGGFYIAEAPFFDLGMDPYLYGIPYHVVDIDINTPEDWDRAEKLYEEMKWKHENFGKATAGMHTISGTG